MNDIKKLAEECVMKFKEGRLSENDLKDLVARAGGNKPQRQQLLYLQASGTSVYSGVLGTSIFTDGRLLDAPEGNSEYRNVADAINDGWRVIKFPEMALLLDSNKTYGLGCEFILEKWS